MSGSQPAPNGSDDKRVLVPSNPELRHGQTAGTQRCSHHRRNKPVSRGGDHATGGDRSNGDDRRVGTPPVALCHDIPQSDVKSMSAQANLKSIAADRDPPFWGYSRQHQHGREPRRSLRRPHCRQPLHDAHTRLRKSGLPRCHRRTNRGES